jgi:hypothetical protein
MGISIFLFTHFSFSFFNLYAYFLLLSQFSQFGYPEMDVVETLQEIFRDNTLILDTHYATTALHAALDVLRSPPAYTSSMRALNAPPPPLVYAHDPRILYFLAALCSSDATAFPHNQNDIAAAIFAPPLGPPITTRIGPSSATIEAFVPAPPNSDPSEAGVWVEVAKLAAHASAGGVKGMFSAAIVPVHHMQCAQWVTAQLNLAAMVCMGQNYRSIHLVEGCHTWKESFKALVQPNIPFDVSLCVLFHLLSFSFIAIRCGPLIVALYYTCSSTDIRNTILQEA